MREPGPMAGKRTRNDQSPTEEERGRDVVTRSIKQEMIEESRDKKEEKAVKRNNKTIDLTNTDEEVEIMERKGEDSGKEDSYEESSDELYGNENSDGSKGSNETSSKEEAGDEMKSDTQESDNNNSEESLSEDEIQVIAVHSP